VRVVTVRCSLTKISEARLQELNGELVAPDHIVKRASSELGARTGCRQFETGGPQTLKESRHISRGQAQVLLKSRPVTVAESGERIDDR
jgi:hypothetical protein